MVSIRNTTSKKSECRPRTVVVGAILGTVVAIALVLMVASSLVVTSQVADQESMTTNDYKALLLNNKSNNATASTTKSNQDVVPSQDTATNSGNAICPMTQLSQLTQSQLHPIAGERHMVSPPKDDSKDSLLYLVCCQSTKGPFNAVLHQAWAPLGVQRLVDMITAGYFSHKHHRRIPLFRCGNHYPKACQFGLNGDPEWTKRYHDAIPDDPPWLPPGPTHRQNERGVKRYPVGMWTYAGSGPNSRSTQMVITLEPNPFMGGGSPWEVPLGELVGDPSFDTISQWYTGYGEQGPSQRILHQQGDSPHVQEQWPLMDYITACDIVDQQPSTTA